MEADNMTYITKSLEKLEENYSKLSEAVKLLAEKLAPIPVIFEFMQKRADASQESIGDIDKRLSQLFMEFASLQVAVKDLQQRNDDAVVSLRFKISAVLLPLLAISVSVLSIVLG